MSFCDSVWYPTLASGADATSLRVDIVTVPQRRIDDRIRVLCAKLQAASHGDLETILQELLKLVHQKNERLKRRAARLLLKGDLEPERRASLQLVNAKLQQRRSDEPGDLD